MLDILGKDLLDTDLDLLNAKYRFLPSKHFVDLQDFKIYLEDALKKHLQDVSKRSSGLKCFIFEDAIKKNSADVLKTSWKTKNCYTEDIFKISSTYV